LFSSLVKTNVEEMKADKDVQGLMRAMKRREVWLRRDAALALGEVGDPRSTDVLVEALKDKNKDVRSAAAEALGKMGGHPGAVEDLLDSL
jgi:HEAT repeat protein